jgi:hypothetical protein
MLVYFFKLIILIWLFFLQNVYADIKIIDGDTIIFNEKKIRLFGIDAPETNQYCFDKKKIDINLSNAVIMKLINMEDL